MASLPKGKETAVKIFLWLLTLAATPGLAAKSTGRSVYLNGIDISSAKNQALSQVNVRIDAQGNIYIEAPQYEVQQETSFVPLGRSSPSNNGTPEHKPPGPLPSKVEVPAKQEEAETGELPPQTTPSGEAGAPTLIPKDGQTPTQPNP